MNLKAIQQKEANLIAEGKGLFALAEKENRDLTDDEKKRDDAIHAELEGVLADKTRAERARDYERALPAVVDVNDPTIDEETRLKATKGQQWESFGEQLKAVYKAGIGNGLSDRERILLYGAASGTGEAVSSDGGFLVNKMIQTTILQRMYNVGEILSRVDNLPIGANFNGVRIPAIDETSRADGARYGGVLGYWLNEADTKTASKPRFRIMELVLKKVAALFYATDELLQDTTALENLIMQMMPEELRFRVEDAIYEGNGAGQPLGIMNSACKIAVAKETGQAAGTIVYQNIIKMWSRMWPPSQSKAVWLYNPDAFPQLSQMALAVGTGGVPVWMPAGGISGAPYSTLMGRPMFPVEYASALGTEGDIMLADLSEYQMIDKGGVQQASSIHVRFINDETTFRFVYRCDGQPKWNAALTPFKGTLTKSPFVTLATR